VAVSLSRVFALRDKLEKGLVAYRGQTLTGDLIPDLQTALLRLLPGTVADTAVFQSLRSLVGQELTSTVLYEFCWRLAGNMPLLKKGEAVLPWTTQVEPEWVPVQVMTYRPGRGRDGTTRSCYRLRVLSGRACSLWADKSWTPKFVAYFARKVGFSATWGKFPYLNPSELVRMRFSVQIDQNYCRDGKPGFDKVEPEAYLGHNRTVLRARAKLKPPCPHSFQHPCYRCWIGYDQCPAGVHPRTYEWKVCSRCNEEAYHDPTHNGVCKGCHRQVMTGEND
jgi:hypothetical protein